MPSGRALSDAAAPAFPQALCILPQRRWQETYGVKSCVPRNYETNAFSSRSHGARYGRASCSRASAIADDRLLRRVPTQLAAQAQREVRQVAGDRDAMGALQVRDRLPGAIGCSRGSRARGRETGPARRRTCPPGSRPSASRTGDGHALRVRRPGDRRTAGSGSRPGMSGSPVIVNPLREMPRLPFVPKNSSGSSGRAAARAFAQRPRRRPAVELEDRVLRVGRLAVVGAGRTGRRRWSTARSLSRPSNQSTMSSECAPRFVICPPE